MTPTRRSGPGIDSEGRPNAEVSTTDPSMMSAAMTPGNCVAARASDGASALPAVLSVVEVDLTDLVASGEVGDEARTRTYVALLRLGRGQDVRLNVGSARSWSRRVASEIAFWTKRAGTVSVVGSDAAGVAQMAADLEGLHRDLAEGGGE